MHSIGAHPFIPLICAVRSPRLPESYLVYSIKFDKKIGRKKIINRLPLETITEWCTTSARINAIWLFWWMAMNFSFINPSSVSPWRGVIKMRGYINCVTIFEIIPTKPMKIMCDDLRRSWAGCKRDKVHTRPIRIHKN